MAFSDFIKEHNIDCNKLLFDKSNNIINSVKESVVSMVYDIIPKKIIGDIRIVAFHDVFPGVECVDVLAIVKDSNKLTKKLLLDVSTKQIKNRKEQKINGVPVFITLGDLASGDFIIQYSIIENRWVCGQGIYELYAELLSEIKKVKSEGKADSKIIPKVTSKALRSNSPLGDLPLEILEEDRMASGKGRIINLANAKAAGIPIRSSGGEAHGGNPNLQIVGDSVDVNTSAMTPKQKMIVKNADSILLSGQYLVDGVNPALQVMADEPIRKFDASRDTTAGLH